MIKTEAMENPETLSRTKIVEDGRIILNVPKLDDGTEVEVKIISTDSESNESVSRNQSNSAQHVNNNSNNSDKNNSKGDTNTFSFEALGLDDDLLEGVIDQNFTEPTEIQQEVIPKILAGKDVVATAQTGSGKTAAFVLPMLHTLLASKRSGKRQPKALILTPTRELAGQIADTIGDLGKYVNLQQVVIYGGVSQKPQVKRLGKGKDIIVATPGRLIDLMNQGHIKLEKLEMFILDEADRMLDMGFFPDIKRILREIPKQRQTLMFSATMPNEIKNLAKEIQDNPLIVSVDPPTSTVDTIDSYLYLVDKSDKFDLLLHLFEHKPEMRKVLIFRRTKYSCDKLMKKLKKKGYYVDRIHGNRSQNQREKALEKFRKNDIDILIGTDVASRGIDVDDITHVINYEITNEPEVYIHRVGRTARAGKDGVAFNFCSKSEQKFIRDIELLTQELMIRVDDHPYKSSKKMKETDLSGKKKHHNHSNKSNKSRKRKKRKYQRRH